MSMDAPITCRPICGDDERFLCQVYASTRIEELAIVPWSDAAKEAFLRMQFTAQHRYYHDQYPQADYQIILAGDHPIGRLYVDRREHEIHILDIALLPEHRRAGIGSALLRAILAEADHVGKPVRIHVERFNAALHLYERLGFVKAGDTGVWLLMERTPGHGSADQRLE
jgi:ribosomal protein S18 acetylase RimI-like enzyme